MRGSGSTPRRPARIDSTTRPLLRKKDEHVDQYTGGKNGEIASLFSYDYSVYTAATGVILRPLRLGRRGRAQATSQPNLLTHKTLLGGVGDNCYSRPRSVRKFEPAVAARLAVPSDTLPGCLKPSICSSSWPRSPVGSVAGSRPLSPISLKRTESLKNSLSRAGSVCASPTTSVVGWPPKGSHWAKREIERSNF